MKIDSRIQNKENYSLRIQGIVQEVAQAYCEYIKTGSFTRFTLKPQQKITIEDLLHIFCDRTDLVNNFLTFVVAKLGQTYSNELNELSNHINIYHRLLETMLYSHQINKKTYLKDI